jgi:hypothetical protein
MPGTGIDIIELTVMKEKSSRQFQICCTKTEKPKLMTMISLTCICPSLKVLAMLDIPEEIYGGSTLI